MGFVKFTTFNMAAKINGCVELNSLFRVLNNLAVSFRAINADQDTKNILLNECLVFKLLLKLRYIVISLPSGNRETWKYLFHF